MASILLTVSFLLENEERDYFIKPMDVIRLTVEVAENMPFFSKPKFNFQTNIIISCLSFSWRQLSYVIGEAKRKKVTHRFEVKHYNRYYDQTHVKVNGINQVEI